MKWNYSEKLKDPRWQRKRLEIFNRDNFCCLICSSDKDTLNVHHERYCKNPWDVPNQDLKTLCFRCHEVVEICKKQGYEYTNVNRLDCGNEIFVNIVNSACNDGINRVAVIHNKNGFFEDTGFFVSKLFVETMLNTF